MEAAITAPRSKVANHYIAKVAAGRESELMRARGVPQEDDYRLPAKWQVRLCRS
jgi:hypothetical protein